MDIEGEEDRQRYTLSVRIKEGGVSVGSRIEG